MTTRHEAIAQALLALVHGAVSAKVIRESELPEECPEDGIINVVPEGPRELEQRLGTGIREWQRLVDLEIVVTGLDDAQRLERVEALLVDLGSALEPRSLAQSGVDHIEVGPPSEPDVIPMDGSESLRGATVALTLFYETSTNVMETAT